MRHFLPLGLLGIALPIAAAAQNACPSTALTDAAQQVAAARHQLHTQAVGESDPRVPPAIATMLTELKGALANAAQAAFACAPTDATAEQLQKTLADALHANLPEGTDTTIGISGKQDVGTYGTDLAVQVFQLFGSPKIFEVDFRYGIECGDDNLLLVFQAGKPAQGWQERLRWGAPAYNTIADAIGDFVMLTPLTGSYKNPSWRFIVAHGQPGCANTPRPSRFDLDLLSPTADPAQPKVDWHFEHAYTRGDDVPRLATTEDTIELRFTPAAQSPAQSPARNAKPAAAEIYRFHLAADGHIEPSAASDTDAHPATPNSPQ